MISSIDAYTQLEQRFATWAQTQSAIQAVIVVGSRARSDRPADEWSDLDLVVFTSDATSYLNDGAWLNTFGEVQVAASNSFGTHDREWIALYADGAKIDVAFLSIDPAAAPTLQAMLDVFPYLKVLQRGVRVLIDKTASSELRLPPIIAPQLPTQAEFTALINRVRFDAIKTAKFIRRSDLWRAKQLCDGELKLHVLKALEWQVCARRDGREIWYDGRFLNEWADREAVAAIPETFAAYRAEDLQRALLATLDLFRRLTHDVAAQLDYIYPAETDQFVSVHIGSILRGSA